MTAQFVHILIQNDTEQQPIVVISIFPPLSHKFCTVLNHPTTPRLGAFLHTLYIHI